MLTIRRYDRRDRPFDVMWLCDDCELVWLQKRHKTLDFVVGKGWVPWMPKWLRRRGLKQEVRHDEGELPVLGCHNCGEPGLALTRGVL